MARDSMADLIQRVRGLTFAAENEFTIGSASYWADNQIQELLDAHRRDLSYDSLSPVTTYVAGGSLSYLEYRTRYGNLEGAGTAGAAFVVQDGVGATVAGSLYAADYLRGVVTFASNQAGSARYLTARAYDVYAAAADLLEQWAAHEKLAFDYRGDDQDMKRSQKHTMLLKQAELYRAQQWVVSVPMGRSDVAYGDDRRWW